MTHPIVSNLRSRSERSQRGCSVCRIAIVLFAAPLAFVASLARAEIGFDEVTIPAGIRYSGETFGAAWGDLDGDGWPDLWVSNHTKPPSLYRNQRDGTFRNVAAEAWSADPTADTHAAAWADFDGDGDLDLVELVGAVITSDELCIGCGENHLFENDRGILRERAKPLGVSQPVGLGRTPLWLDADLDGRLDLLAVNQRFGDKAPSILYRQTDDGFRDFGEQSGFVDAAASKYEKGMNLLWNALAGRFWQPSFSTQASRAFAQLADLSGDGNLDLILHTVPTRVYSLKTLPFEEITVDLGFPEIGEISDAAIEDFDGDRDMDLYVTRGPYATSIVTQKSPTVLKARLGWSRTGPANSPAIEFRSRGRATFRILYPYWMDTTQILVGSAGKNPESTSFTLSPEDPDLGSPLSAAALTREGVLIGFDAATDTWTFRNATKISMEFTISSTSAIEDLARVNFPPFREQGVDALLLRGDEEFSIEPLSGEAGRPTACHSVVAGDFDNDMDMDLYLVCSGPIENLPNRLFENDGTGSFASVPRAGGAAGSDLGRGDVAVTADYDRDGFLDLFVTNGSDPGSEFVADGPHQLFHNRGNDNHWIEIDLVGTKSNRDGIGAILTLEAGGVTQRREQGGGMHVYAQNHRRIHFGLGRHASVDRLTVRWPSGTVQRLEHLPADRIVEVEECEEAATDGSCTKSSLGGEHSRFSSVQPGAEVGRRRPTEVGRRMSRARGDRG